MLEKCVRSTVCSTKCSRTFQVPVQDPRKIGEMFDKIAYNKGASIIRMLENFIGDEVSTINTTSTQNNYYIILILNILTCSA